MLADVATSPLRVVPQAGGQIGMIVSVTQKHETCNNDNDIQQKSYTKNHLPNSSTCASAEPSLFAALHVYLPY